MYLDLRGKRYQASGPARVASDIEDQQVAGAVHMMRHLHRENAFLAQLLQESGQDSRMIWNPLQRGVGKNQIGRRGRSPHTNVSFDPIEIREIAAAAGEHL